MCLYLREYLPVRNLLPRRKTIKRYKVYAVRDGKLYPPIQDEEAVRVGTIVSDRLDTKLTWDEYISESIYKGIHVATTKRHARKIQKHHPDSEIFVVYCDRDDLIACGRYGDEVYTKIELRQDDYDRVMVKSKLI